MSVSRTRDTDDMHEIRDAIHGFIPLNSLEWDIINHSTFQRLRRIRQLAFTELIYPGATHTRFEHSLGVMHVASRLFDAIEQRQFEVLSAAYGYKKDTLTRQRQIVRLAVLLHDIGHGPFSHAAEHLLPHNASLGRSYSHEDYSAAILRAHFADLIENHKIARRAGIRCEDIEAMFTEAPRRPGDLVWKPLVAGQMDADRMDYLLRDAHHAGVNYGKFDLDRVVNTLCLCPNPDGDGHTIGVKEDGIHAVEGLLIARYMMFTQVYLHRTRSIYDFHLGECLRHLLANDSHRFPPPAPARLLEYLDWDDWRVVGEISSGRGGTHGEIIRNRQHFRMVYETREVPTPDEILEFDELATQLASLNAVSRIVASAWYRADARDIPVSVESRRTTKSVPLSERSPVVKGLTPIGRRRLYVAEQNRERADGIVAARGLWTA